MKAKRMKIAIIGKGNVGSSLGKGLRNAGHEIKFGHRDPKEPVAEAAKWGELIIIAVPHENAKNAIDAIGEFADNKIVIDVMNAVGQNLSSTIVCTTSMAEQTQERLPKALVIKAFNKVFAKNQSTARVGDQKLTAFIVGNSQKAKDTVAQLTRDIGFDPVDCGSIEAARHLESMAIMLINLAYKYNMGADIGYKLVKA
jgi:predicted dinucleotide-binding enzyme